MIGNSSSSSAMLQRTARLLLQRKQLASSSPTLSLTESFCRTHQQQRQFFIPRVSPSLSSSPTLRHGQHSSLSFNNHQHDRFSTDAQDSDSDSSGASSYATVFHGDTFQEEMTGRHGKQLALAYNESLVDFESEAVNKILLDDLIDTQPETPDDDSKEEEEEEDLDTDVAHFFKTYHPDGSRIDRDKVQLASWRAGAPSGGIFAVIHIGGKQHKVTVDDVIVSDKLKPVEFYTVGKILTLTEEDIMLMGTQSHTLVGMPRLEKATGASVTLQIEELTKDAKIVIFKKRRRKHSRRKNGFRREVSLLRVVDIQLPEDLRGSSGNVLGGNGGVLPLDVLDDDNKDDLVEDGADTNDMDSYGDSKDERESKE